MQDLLVNGLEKLALVFPHLGMIYFLDQLGVFINEPCFPEYIGSCVLYLQHTVGKDTWDNAACTSLMHQIWQSYSCDLYSHEKSRRFQTNVKLWIESCTGPNLSPFDSLPQTFQKGKYRKYLQNMCSPRHISFKSGFLNIICSVIIRADLMWILPHSSWVKSLGRSKWAHAYLWDVGCFIVFSAALLPPCVPSTLLFKLWMQTKTARVGLILEYKKIHIYAQNGI